MTTYRMTDGRIVKTDNAAKQWEEETDFDGSNHISRVTGSQWHHQTLFRSKKGNYWIESWSNYQNCPSTAEWISAKDAARWMLLNDYELPGDLSGYVDELEE